jgi:LysR family transcriptional regulator for metE and metH
MELIHLRILLALKAKGSLVAASKELFLTQSALSHQIKSLEQRLGVKLWNRKGRALELTQAGHYLSKLAESIIPAINSAEYHVSLLGQGKTGQFTIGIDCHACFEWLRTILQPFLEACPDLEVDVTSRYRFDSFAAIAEYKLDAVLTSDPAFDGILHYEPLFDFELLLIVSKGHALAESATIEPAQLVNETILTYPVPRHRLDIFNRILQPNNIEPRNHKQVEETDIMLQLVASNRGICLLPEWLLAEKSRDMALTGLRIKDQPLNKTMYLAMRPEDIELEYIRTFIRLSGNKAIS